MSLPGFFSEPPAPSTSVAAPDTIDPSLSSIPDITNTSPQDFSGEHLDPSKPKRKAREEFSAKDIDELLSAVIKANPYGAQRSHITDKWKEVMRITQGAGACLGRDHETMKNKVKSLVIWVQSGGKKLSARSPFAREAEKDPASFASLSNKLDAVEVLYREAQKVKETKSSSREGQETPGLIDGAQLHITMNGESHGRKRLRLSETDSEEDGQTSRDSPSGLRFTHKRGRDKIERLMMEFMERHSRWQERMLEEQTKANELIRRQVEANERATNALIVVLREGLLKPQAMNR